MTKTTIHELERRAGTVVAHLSREEWSPVTNMLLPSVLRGADRLIVELVAYVGPGRDRADALLAKVRQVLALYRCVDGGLPD